MSGGVARARVFEKHLRSRGYCTTECSGRHSMGPSTAANAHIFPLTCHGRQRARAHVPKLARRRLWVTPSSATRPCPGRRASQGFREDSKSTAPWRKRNPVTNVTELRVNHRAATACSVVSVDGRHGAQAAGTWEMARLTILSETTGGGWADGSSGDERAAACAGRLQARAL